MLTSRVYRMSLAQLRLIKYASMMRHYPYGSAQKLRAGLALDRALRLGGYISESLCCDAVRLALYCTEERAWLA